MPTVEAGSRYANIHKSINSYVNANIAITLGYTVYYMGSDRTGTLPTEWVEAYLTPAVQNQEARIAGYRSFAVWMECYLNLNLFQMLGAENKKTNIYELITMADNIRNYFEYNTHIPIRDYDTAGNPIVSGLRVLEKPEMTYVPIDQGTGLRQVNISVSLRHNDVTTD